MAEQDGAATVGGSPAAADRPEQTQVTVEVNSKDVGALLQAAEAHGLEAMVVEADHVLEPVSASIVILGGTAAVGAILYWVEQRRGGQVFDLRPNAATPAYRTPDVAYGYVFVIAADGKVTVEVKEPKGAFGIVVEAISSAVIDLGKAGLEAVKAATEAAVADKGTVTTEPLLTG